MNRNEIERRIEELKSDYIRIQGDMEKLESLGKNGNVAYSEKLLEEIELELKQLREMLNSVNDSKRKYTAFPSVMRGLNHFYNRLRCDNEKVILKQDSG